MGMNAAGMGAPVFYDHINAANSIVQPSTVHVKDSGLSRFFQRYLLQKALSVFKWEIPTNWSRDYFLYSLYCWGVCRGAEYRRIGVIPQACGLQGYDVFYRPTHAIITNPLLRGLTTLRIGTQCTLFKLQPDYGGIYDLVSYYADMMALSSETAGINLLNSRLSYVFTAGDKAAAESLKKLYDQIASGQPATFIDKSLSADGKAPWQQFEQNVGQNYIVGNILTDLRKWEQMFDNDIGIPNANTDKKERLLTDEVNSNNTETASKCALWLEELQKTCAETEKMFGIKMSVDWRVKPLVMDTGKEGAAE